VAEIVPFPASRRVRLIRTAALTMTRRVTLAESYLHQRLSAHAEILRRKGVSRHEIEADLKRYEGAVRAVLRFHTSGSGGAV
jgi:hypothetical protein